MNQDSISTIEFNNQLMELLCKDVDKDANCKFLFNKRRASR